ncbi:MAG TPA: hypothetical protein VMR52_11010 [Dehalococcoidia bacterium]|nr:hypothetical protein [Dehalococcoidia bacterium]
MPLDPETDILLAMPVSPEDIRGAVEWRRSVHPNAFGQRALGRCLTLLYAKASGNWTCGNTPGGNYNQMSLSLIP